MVIDFYDFTVELLIKTVISKIVDHWQGMRIVINWNDLIISENLKIQINT